MTASAPITSSAPDPVEVPTPHGPARITAHPAAEPRAVLLLGHGAGGGIGAPDLLGATRAALGVDQQNPNEAQTLYERLGFRITMEDFELHRPIDLGEAGR